MNKNFGGDWEQKKGNGGGGGGGGWKGDQENVDMSKEDEQDEQNRLAVEGTWKHVTAGNIKDVGLLRASLL